jgi:hypothetical protein
MNATTTAPVAHDPIAIDDALIDLHHTLTHTPDMHPNSSAMISAIRSGVMHLHYGRLARAAGIVDRIRTDLAAV